MSISTLTRIDEICQTISETYRGKDKKVILINTSDVLEGKILNFEEVENKNLRGQFKKTFKKNDILFSEIRPANKRFAFVNIDDTHNFIASTKLMVLRPNLKIVLPEFLYYILSSDYLLSEMQHLAETRSGTFPQITFSSELGPFEIELPDINCQRKIVSILKNIDKKIELNNEINDNLMQQGTSLFNEYLVKFDDVPNNWKVSSLDRIADYINGLAMQKYPPKDNEEGLPVLKIAELKQGCCDSNSDRCTSQLDEDYIINDGDVIFSWSASLVVDIWCGGKAGLNQHLFNVKSNIYDKWFYFWWTKYHLNEFIHEASSKATTMGHIKRDNLSKAKVLIPSKNDYEAIGHLLKPITDSIVNVKLENKRLSALRDSLLPKLMSGEIDVDSIEL